MRDGPGPPPPAQDEEAMKRMIDAGEDEVNRNRRCSTAADGEDAGQQRGSGRKHHTCHNKHRKRSKSHRRKRKSRDREDRDLEAGRGQRREGSFDRAYEREGNEDGEAGQLTPKHIFYNYYSTDVTWEEHEESLEGSKWSVRAKKAALKFAVGHKVELAIAALCLFILFLLRISGAHPTWLCCGYMRLTPARHAHAHAPPHTHTHHRTRTHGALTSVARAEVARVVHGLRGVRYLLHVGQEGGAQRRGDGVRHYAPSHTRHRHPQRSACWCAPPRTPTQHTRTPQRADLGFVCFLPPIRVLERGHIDDRGVVRGGGRHRRDRLHRPVEW